MAARERIYRLAVVVEGDNPYAGKPTLSGRDRSEESADMEEIRRRIRGTYAHVPHMTVSEGPDQLLGTVDELERKLADADGAVDTALALHAEHVRGLRGETECVCLGCQMSRLLRGEETR